MEALPRRHRIGHFTLVILLVTLLWQPLAGCSKDASQRPPQPAPDFRLSCIDGSEEVCLSALRGKVVVLDFWATWCPPCRAAIPHMVELQEKYRADGLAILGMNMDKNEEDLDGFLSSQTMNYPNLRVDDATRQAYEGVASIPVAYVIDRKGMVRNKYLGYDHKIAEEMEELIQVLLSEEL